jgi:hypothetical protein
MIVAALFITMRFLEEGCVRVLVLLAMVLIVVWKTIGLVGVATSIIEPRSDLASGLVGRMFFVVDDSKPVDSVHDIKVLPHNNEYTSNAQKGDAQGSSLLHY